ncbi:hypothetical protein ANN_05937 [Periplaneta americana]|uniref:AMP-dependent synthetase/ligase domain-containing protein n=1 Tax=Periplaneta americana TaxID=6978 RepID=A0ABQ8TC67_PERAM|nr:hypothetical protein ANN_05937 [Periplaneta americana]
MESKFDMWLGGIRDCDTDKWAILLQPHPQTSNLINPRTRSPKPFRQKMHCPRSLLRWGLQVLRRKENRRLLSLSPAVTQIVKSAYPDVPVPTVSLPEYVWSRIDEWPDKVAIGRWCDIVVINAHAPTEEKDDHIKDSFYEELEQTFDQLPRYHMKILLGDFNAKVGREDIFKPTIGKESLHISSNDNGVSLLSKNLKVRISKTVILPVVLYGCETWTLTLREKHRFRVFENKVLRKIFGAKRDEVTGEWRKLHNTELHALYSSPDIIRNIKSRRLRWAGHVACMGESRNAYTVLVGRPEGKRPLGRPRRRWEDNIKMDLREVGYDDREWINFAQDRDQWRAYVRAAMNLRECGVTGRHYTYAEARELSRRFAASLYRIGLQPGDTLAIIMPNSPEWPIVFLGALEAGIIVTTINPIYTADEMSHQLRDSGAKAIVTISMIHSTITKAVKMVAGKTNPLVIIAPGFEQGSDLPAGTIDLMDMLQDGIDTSSVRFRGDTNDLAVLLYSSGTTGLPKGVMLSQRNLAASSVQYNSRTEICPCQPANGTHQDLSPIISPFYHIFGMCLSLLSNMYYGVKLVTMPKFEPKSFVKLLEHHDVNFMYVTPPLLLFMASYSGVKPEHLRSLRYVLSGAAPLGKLDIERFLEKAPKSPNVVQGYGLTESGGTTTIMEKDGTKYESVGGPIPNTEVKVWHVETGLDLGHQEVGEVCIRGPQVMKGYFNRPDATAEAIDGEGWLHTGDLGYYDEEGKFYIVDRSKELIKVKGFQTTSPGIELMANALKPHLSLYAAVVVLS